jgi:hypothetical protein
MAQKPFKEITDRDLFAGLIMAAFAAKDPDKPIGRPCRPRRRGGRPPDCGAQGAGRQAAGERHAGPAPGRHRRPERMSRAADCPM